MKLINVDGMEIVFSGKPWMHNIQPCAKQAIPLLERNEKIVSWLKPVGGTVSEHIPAILFNGKFYSLSLRMQKAIYRHIRLKKGFKNEEVMDGIAKLRIPDVLLKEKIRTQSRFDAMRKGIVSDTTKQDENSIKRGKKSKSTENLVVIHDLKKKKRKILEDDMEEEVDEELKEKITDDPESDWENDEQPTAKKSDLISKRERIKTTCTVSARMKQVVEQMVLCTQEQYDIAMQQTTVFAFKSLQSEIVSCFLEDLRRENPPIMQNKAALLQLIDEAYEKSQSLIMLHNNMS